MNNEDNTNVQRMDLQTLGEKSSSKRRTRKNSSDGRTTDTGSITITRGSTETRTNFQKDKETDKKTKDSKVSITLNDLNNSGLTTDWDSKRSGAVYPFSGVYSGNFYESANMLNKNITDRARIVKNVSDKMKADKIYRNSEPTATGQPRDSVYIRPEMNISKDNTNSGYSGVGINEDVTDAVKSVGRGIKKIVRAIFKPLTTVRELKRDYHLNRAVKNRKKIDKYVNDYDNLHAIGSPEHDLKVSANKVMEKGGKNYLHHINKARELTAKLSGANIPSNEMGNPSRYIKDPSMSRVLKTLSQTPKHEKNDDSSSKKSKTKTGRIFGSLN